MPYLVVHTVVRDLKRASRNLTLNGTRAFQHSLARSAFSVIDHSETPLRRLELLKGDRHAYAFLQSRRGTQIGPSSEFL